MQQHWCKESVVYQIWPRSFADGDADGIGDLAGITSRLDYLATLGVDVLWLSPIYPSPQDDAGYDISDYQDIDPTFGSLEQFDGLLAAVHERGMKFIMDLVVNHTSDEHPWFVESRASKDNPKRDWYWWRPAREGMSPGDPGAEPNNWGSIFSGSAWELDDETGEYYLHLFSRKQPDLNWENPEVRQAVYSMMRWWLERGIDDFRDIQSLNHYAEAVGMGADPETVLAALRVRSRDNARTPMQWDDTENAGFTTGTPWIAVNPNHKEINAQAELADGDSVFHYYRRLIELRHTEPAVAHGDFHMLLADHDQVYAFTRRYGSTELLVLANFFGELVTIEVPDADRWQGTEVVIANYPVDATENLRDLTLRPFEARVYRLR
jgi:glycosidase